MPSCWRPRSASSTPRRWGRFDPPAGPDPAITPPAAALAVWTPIVGASLLYAVDQARPSRRDTPEVEGNVLQPYVVGRSVDVHPLAILLGLTAGSVLAGFIGAIVASPTVAVGAAVLRYLRKDGSQTADDPGEEPSAVRRPWRRPHPRRVTTGVSAPTSVTWPTGSHAVRVLRERSPERSQEPSMRAHDTSSLDRAPERARDRAAVTTLYTVTVTSRGTGRVQTVQVPARSAQSAFPIACAWYPLLPLTGAVVQVTVAEPATPAPARAAA